MKYFLKTIFISLLLIQLSSGYAQYTHQDTLRGSDGPGRIWWDVKHYNINVRVDIEHQQITGINVLTFAVTQPGKNKIMQIDLQQPMEIVKIEDANHKPVSLKREGNVYWIDFGEKKFDVSVGEKDWQMLAIYFKGTPRKAVNPPWDGGWVWAKDEKGRPWITVACQGLGASVWYPCKDYQADEPDKGALLSVIVPDSLVVVGNGIAAGPVTQDGKTKTYNWSVQNPINNYDIVPYIGKYVNWSDIYMGEKGPLTCEFWVLDYDLEKAKKQFGRDVKPMLKCFEYWFGPYPFYEDNYKLVEAPHLGMEHQSAIAYGNQFRNGYLGTDLSGTGWGTKWDYIIVHESGHEWFGNNITTKDIADMWVHEGFTNYSEVLFVECQYGKKAGNEYLQGLRRDISNRTPVIGPYGVNKEGSTDMYSKGANLVHTIRQVINDDEKFRALLRGLNKEFYHKTTTSAEVENYLTEQSGKDFSKIFDQYLRTADIPVLEYKITGKSVSFRWANCIAGFNMPVLVSFGKNQQWITPAKSLQTITPDGFDGKTFAPDSNFYIIISEMKN